MKFINILLLVIFISGCTKKPSLHVEKESLALQNIIISISDGIKKNEAQNLAQQTYLYAKKLQSSYELAKPPLFHNFLVNIGVKKRGLCWHFAYDLLSHIKKQNYASFDYYIVGANIDDYWEEHNALLVTCQGCSAQKGVIIDLWRNSAKPFFVRFGFDTEYKWRVRGSKR